MLKKIFIILHLFLASFFAWSEDANQSSFFDKITQDKRPFYVTQHLYRKLLKNPKLFYMMNTYYEMEDGLTDEERLQRMEKAYGDTQDSTFRLILRNISPSVGVGVSKWVLATGLGVEGSSLESLLPNQYLEGLEGLEASSRYSEAFVNSAYECEDNSNCSLYTDSAYRYLDSILRGTGALPKFRSIDKGEQHFLTYDEIEKDPDLAWSTDSFYTEKETLKEVQEIKGILINHTVEGQERAKQIELGRIQGEVDLYKMDPRVRPIQEEINKLGQYVVFIEEREKELSSPDEATKIKEEIKPEGHDDTSSRIKNINNPEDLKDLKSEIEDEIAKLEKEKTATNYQISLEQVQQWTAAGVVAAQLLNADPSVIKAGQATIAGIGIAKAVGSMIITGALDPTGITAVLTGISSLVQIFGEPGPTPDQIIIDTLQEVKANQVKMLKMLGQLDEKIDELQESIDHLVIILEKNHREIMDEFDQIHEELRDIGNRLYNIEYELRLAKQEKALEKTNNAIFNIKFRKATGQSTLYEDYARCKNRYTLDEETALILSETKYCVSKCLFRNTILQRDPSSVQECLIAKCINIEKNKACDLDCVNNIRGDKVKDIQQLELCIDLTYAKLSQLENDIYTLYTQSRDLGKPPHTIENYEDAYDSNNQIIDSFSNNEDPDQRVSQLPTVFKLLYEFFIRRIEMTKKLEELERELEDMGANKNEGENLDSYLAIEFRKEFIEKQKSINNIVYSDVDDFIINKSEIIGKTKNDLENNESLLMHPSKLDNSFSSYVQGMQELPPPGTSLGVKIYKNNQTEGLDQMCKEVKYIEDVSEYSRQNIQNAINMYTAAVLQYSIQLGPYVNLTNHSESGIFQLIEEQIDHIYRRYDNAEERRVYLFRDLLGQRALELVNAIELTDQTKEDLKSRHDGFQTEIKDKNRCHTYKRSGEEVRYAGVNNPDHLQLVKETLTTLQKENAQGGCWFYDKYGLITGFHAGTKFQLYRRYTVVKLGEEVDAYVPMCGEFVTDTKLVKKREPAGSGSSYYATGTRRAICLETDLAFLRIDNSSSPIQKLFSNNQIYFITEFEKERGWKPQQLQLEAYRARVIDFYDDRVIRSDSVQKVEEQMSEQYPLIMKIDDSQTSLISRYRDSYGECRKYACLATKEVSTYEFDRDGWTTVAQTDLANHMKAIQDRLIPADENEQSDYLENLKQIREIHFGLSTLIRFGYGDEQLRSNPKLAELKALLINMETHISDLLSDQLGKQFLAIYYLTKGIATFRQQMEVNESIIPLNVSSQEYGVGQLGIRKEAFETISDNEHWDVKECSYP